MRDRCAARCVTACIVLAVLLATCSEAVDTGTHKPYSYEDDDRPVLVPHSSWRYAGKGRPFYTFLTLDGGGLRGIVSTTVLLEVEKQIKLYILSNLDDFELATTVEGRTKESYNYNTIKDFSIYLADFFHGIAGISAGSWIGAYLVTKGGDGYSRNVFRHPSVVEKYGSIRPGAIEGLRVFFLEYGSRIYSPTTLPISLVPRPLALPLVKLRPWTAPLYDPMGLEWTLKMFNGDSKLSDVHTSFLVVTFDLSRMSAVEFVADYLNVRPTAKQDEYVKPDIYTGVCVSQSDVGGKKPVGEAPKTADFESPDDNQSEKETPKEAKCGEDGGDAAMEKLCKLDYYVRDIVRASSAFPMVNPAKLVKPLNDVTNYFNMIDGAMVGNNPTLPTIAWALTHKAIKRISQTAFLSLGTGFAEGSYEEIAEGGYMQWVGPIISLITGSTPEFIQAMVDYVFYVANSRPDSQISANQLLRIQLVRDASTPEGAMLAGIAPNHQQVLKMEEMAAQLGSRYSPNIYHFVKTFLCKTESTPKKKAPSESAEQLIL